MRPGSTERGYGYAWQRARLAYLAEHPLCEPCLARGKVELATVVDHKRPHKGDETLFWDRSNWQAMSKACHDGWKQAQDKGGGMKGCDADGRPIDPNHEWNRPEDAA